MNKLDAKNINKYLYLDIKDYIWELLEQWKAIIAFVVIFMMLLLLLSGVVHSGGSSETAAPKEVVTETQEDILKPFSPSEQELILSTLNTYKTLDTLTDYVNNSVLMKINAYDARQMVICYRVDADSELTPSLITDYSNACISSRMTEAIVKAWDGKYSALQVSELVFTTKGIYNQTTVVENDDDNLIYVYVILPDGIDGEKTIEAVDDTVRGFYKEFSSTMGEHKLVKLTADVKTVANPMGIAEKQGTIFSRLNAISTQIRNTSANAFTYEQNGAYEKLVKLYNSEDDDQSTGQAEVPEGDKQQDSFIRNMLKIGKLKLMLGLIASGVLYVILSVGYILFTGKIQSPASLKEITGIRNLGECYFPSGKKGIIGKLLSSKTILRHRHKTHLDHETELNNSVASIVSIAEHFDLKDILISFNSSSSQEKLEFVEKLKESLTSRGLKVKDSSFTDENGCQIKDADVCESDGALLIVDRQRTNNREIKDICEKCSFYGVPVIGSVYLG